ncbi:MAG: 30S ribosomal protein S20 [Bacteroidales bacterium]|jgi:small subunit ribosomal protein S20|nr:30S ribosomal protein S20 [Bacteroidales bacterium]MBR4115263.1 30S ribosomal protein S20 [Bacteroidales bacterium]MBR4349409.1 30S ribosomal protein S20 [Bacteroidales bacterium]MBR6266240.1 30S ribosomal protein S20 [Bacteroidales bacterium]MCR4799208.1 30S ribosomal protein S20 [Bacteroidales bacterium]
MANTKSAAKAARKAKTRTLHNKYYAKTMRNAVRDLKATKEKKDAEAQVSKVCSMIDKLAKTNVIHKNKASNLKSSCMRYVNSLA